MGLWGGGWWRCWPLLILGALGFLLAALGPIFGILLYFTAIVLASAGFLITVILYLIAASRMPQLALLRRVVYAAIGIFSAGILTTFAGLVSVSGTLGRGGLVLVLIAVVLGGIGGLLLMFKVETELAARGET